MKRIFVSVLLMICILSFVLPLDVFASDVSLCNNNTLSTTTGFSISTNGRATVGLAYEGYPNITTGATITIKIEKRNLLLFWRDVIDETITVVGDSYFNEMYYQLEDTGTYRCTVVYTVSGTGGADDVLTFEKTAKYE